MDGTETTEASEKVEAANPTSTGQSHFVIDNEEEEGDGIDLNKGKGKEAEGNDQ